MRSSLGYSTNVCSPASTIIEHDNNRKATLMIQHLVMVPAATMTSRAVARLAPLAIMTVAVPVISMIVTVFSIVSIRPVSVPIIAIRPTVVTIGSPVVAIRSTIVVSMVRVAATIVGWVTRVVPVV